VKKNNEVIAEKNRVETLIEQIKAVVDLIEALQAAKEVIHQCPAVLNASDFGDCPIETVEAHLKTSAEDLSRLTNELCSAPHFLTAEAFRRFIPMMSQRVCLKLANRQDLQELAHSLSDSRKDSIKAQLVAEIIARLHDSLEKTFFW